MKKLLWLLPIIGALLLLTQSCSDSPSNVLDDCERSDLVVAFSDGVTSNLSQGSTNYACNEEVSYQFSLESGYENLNVLLDGEPIAPQGSILMNETRLLTATVRRIPIIRNETEPLTETLANVMSGSNSVEDYQKFVDQAFKLFEKNPDSARIWLEDVERIVIANYSEEERKRVDRELSGRMFFNSSTVNSNPNKIEANRTTRVTDVVFINGIWNTESMARNSSFLLQDITKAAGLDNYINSFIYNPTTKQVGVDNKLECYIEQLYPKLGARPLTWIGYLDECTPLGDLNQALNQMIDVERPPDTSRKIAEQLYNRISKGNQVIVVAHSQGNLMIRDAIESHDILSDEMKKSISIISLAAPDRASRDPILLADFDCWIIRGDIIKWLPGSGCDNNSFATDYERWLKDYNERNNLITGTAGTGVPDEIQTVAIHSVDNYFGNHPAEFTGLKQEKDHLKQTLLKHQESLSSFVGEPDVITKAITNITSTTAASGGIVETNGGLPLEGRGVCWSTSPEPNINDGPCTSDGNDLGEFESQLSNLDPDTKYYVRAYAVNSIETGYGEEKSFTTSQQLDLPTVSTSSISSITEHSAQSGGNVTDDGNTEVTARGVCWSTSQNPTTSDDCTSDGSGTGSFTSNLTNLNSDTQYYVRAYATNSEGTSYGNQRNFTTDAEAGFPSVSTSSISSITENSAQSGGNVTDDGGASVTARGVCWSTSQNPTTSDDCTSDGSGTGSFSSNLTNLNPDTQYYVRAYATNSEGTAYGNQRNFTTDAEAGLPSVSTSSISSITENSAQSGGNVSDDGGASVTARGVCWSTSQNPTTSDDCTSDGSGTGSFTSNLTSLSSDTRYYVRAYATNSEGTAYGNQRNFTTNKEVEPGISLSLNPENLSIEPGSSESTSATISRTNFTGNITLTVMTNLPSGVSSTINQPGSGNSGTVTFSLANNHANFENFEVRIRASGSGVDSVNEYVYLDIKQEGEISLSLDPTHLAIEPGSSKATTASISRNGFDGNVNLTVMTSLPSGVSSSIEQPGSGNSGTVTFSLANNHANFENFEVRIRASGDGVSNVQDFVYLDIDKDEVELPSVSTSSISSITENSAQSGGNITNDGGASVTARGVCWSTSQNPTTSDDCTSDGSGTGSFSSNLTNLNPDTQYYVRAYATNSEGTAYGNQRNFTTESETETYSISGEVMDETGSAISDLSMLLIRHDQSSNLTTSTNSSGFYSFDDLPAGQDYSVAPQSNDDFEPSNRRFNNLQSNQTQNFERIGDEIEFPSVSTSSISSITETSAQSGGNVTDDGGASVTARGVCWSTSQNPTTSDDCTSDGNGTGNYTSNMTNLNPDTQYYVRAYATNSEGTGYGNQRNFTTEPESDDSDWPRDTDTEVVEVTSATGRVWMDRNLGASRAATSSTDEQAYGDLYQWGRAADGHQKRNSGTTTTLSSSDIPGHGDFIRVSNSPLDWRSPQNNNLWQGLNGTNNPCPIGYRLPTEAEWNNERESWSSHNAAGAFASPLKLPLAGQRNGITGSLSEVGSRGGYWWYNTDHTYVNGLSFSNSAAGLYSSPRSYGHTIRCIKN